MTGLGQGVADRLRASESHEEIVSRLLFFPSRLSQQVVCVP